MPSCPSPPLLRCTTNMITLFLTKTQTQDTLAAAIAARFHLVKHIAHQEKSFPGSSIEGEKLWLQSLNESITKMERAVEAYSEVKNEVSEVHSTTEDEIRDFQKKYNNYKQTGLWE